MQDLRITTANYIKYYTKTKCKYGQMGILTTLNATLKGLVSFIKWMDCAQSSSNLVYYGRRFLRNARIHLSCKEILAFRKKCYVKIIWNLGEYYVVIQRDNHVPLLLFVWLSLLQTDTLQQSVN